MKFAFKAKSLILLLIFMLLVTMSMQFNALALAPPRNCIIVNQKLLENYQYRLNMFPLRAVMEQLGYDVQWNDIDQTVVFCKGTADVI